MYMRIGLIGYGAFCREIMPRLKIPYDIFYYGKIDKELYKSNKNMYDISKFNSNIYKALVTVSDVNERENIIKMLPKNTDYYTYIDKNALLIDTNTIKIGKGTIICAGSVITTNVEIGDFVQINLNTTVGHDSKIGNFTTIAPGVNISGNSLIGNKVYLGTNCSTRQKVVISDNVTIGMNSGVTKNIEQKGIYIGTPAIKIKD